MKTRMWTGLGLSFMFGVFSSLAGIHANSVYFWLLLAVFLAYGITERYCD